MAFTDRKFASDNIRHVNPRVALLSSLAFSQRHVQHKMHSTETKGWCSHRRNLTNSVSSFIVNKDKSQDSFDGNC